MTTWYFTRIGPNETFTQTAADLAGFAYEDDVTLPDGTTTDRFQAVPVADQQHTSGLYLARATDSFDPSAQAIGASITFAATPLRPYFVGAFVRAEDAADSTTFIEGEITAYDPDTGDLTIQVVRTAGSGTVSDWLIKSAGRAGAFAFSGLTFEYNFDTSTSDADPGAGNLRADNSDLTAATELYVDDETADGASVKAALQTIADSTNPTLGQLLIATKFDPTKFVLYDVTGFTDASGYRKVNVTHVDGSGASPFPNSAAVIFGFSRAGDKGDKGDKGNSDFDWIVKSSAYTASKDDRILADTSGGAFPIMLPGSPSIGHQVAFADAKRTWATNNLTVDGNGNNVLGSSTFIVDLDDWPFSLTYNGTQWVFGSRP